MSIQTLVEGKKFKSFMSKLYGFGASVVIIGAMFKIQHWPGAGVMLTVGLSTEAIIFFFSAFQAAHEEPDWSLVYPELAGHDDSVDFLDMESEQDKQLEKPITQQLDDLLSNAKIGPDLLDSLKTGLENLSNNASKMYDVSQATVVTEEYITNLKGASTSVGELKNTYVKTAQALSADLNVTEDFVTNVKAATASVNSLSTSYNNAATALNSDLESTKEYSESVKSAIQSASLLGDQYKVCAEKLIKSAEVLDFTKLDSGAYQLQMEKIANSLSSLNSVYELQLQYSTTQNSATNALNESVDKLKQNLDNTVQDTLKFKEEIARLNDHLSSLNNVYGNMLSAMSLR